MKLLLALQYWEGDKALAMKLARLIADMEDRHSEKADFLFFSRYDCSHDIESEKFVSRKFNTYSATCRRRSTGWPHGCNDLWFGAMDWVYTMGEAKKIPNYKAILTFEADSCPLVPHWLSVLSAAWDTAQKLKPTYVYGPYLQYPGPHINGNSMFSGDARFVYWLARQKVACAPDKGWDYVMAKEFSQWGWENCPAMKSYWRSPTITEDLFHSEVCQGVAFLHGVKDDSAIAIARKKYNLPPF